MANASTFGFCAAGGTLPDVQFEDSTRCILKGFLIDEVDGLGAKQQAGHTMDSEDKLLQPISEANAYQTDVQVSNAIWMTLVADQGFEGTKESWRAPAYFGFIYAKQFFTLARKWSLNERLDSR
jgi:surface antigen